MNPVVKTYSRLYLHAAKLTFRALKRFWPYLFVAPVASLAYHLLSQSIFGFTGPLGGFVVALIRAAVISGVLFAVRGIVEQRRLSMEELGQGFTVFFGDVLTVFFTLWIVGMLVGMVLGGGIVSLLYLAVFFLPVAEAVALGGSSGFLVFQSAFRFFQRDWLAWIVAHLPLIPLFWVYLDWNQSMGRLLHLLPNMPRPLSNVLELGLYHLSAMLLMIALVYRGIVYLTLDDTSPRARARRFGGVDSPW